MKTLKCEEVYLHEYRDWGEGTLPLAARFPVWIPPPHSGSLHNAETYTMRFFRPRSPKTRLKFLRACASCVLVCAFCDPSLFRWAKQFQLRHR
jgi:hypothetical protein